MRALAGWEKQLGPNHPETLMAMRNPVKLHESRNKLDKVDTLYARALAGRERKLGADRWLPGHGEDGKQPRHSREPGGNLTKPMSFLRDRRGLAGREKLVLITRTMNMQQTANKPR